MKRLSVLLLTSTLLVVCTVPALAAAGSPPASARRAGSGVAKVDNPPFALAETIASLHAQAKMVTVTVVCGNAIVKPFIGQNLVIQTNDATRFLLRIPGSYATQITFGDLAIGQKVSVNGQYSNYVWTAPGN